MMEFEGINVGHGIAAPELPIVSHRRTTTDDGHIFSMTSCDQISWRSHRFDGHSRRNELDYRSGHQDASPPNIPLPDGINVANAAQYCGRSPPDISIARRAYGRPAACRRIVL